MLGNGYHGFDRWGEGGEIDAFDGDFVFLQCGRAAEDGGEHDDGGGGEQGLDLVEEAHAQHLVGLVEACDATLGEVEVLAAPVVEHTAWGADDDGRAAVELAVEGLGICYAPCFALSDALASGRLVPVMPDVEGEAAPVSTVYLEGRSLPRKVRALIDFAAEDISLAGVL